MGHAQDYFVDRIVYCNSNNLMTFAWLVFVPFSEAGPPSQVGRGGHQLTNTGRNVLRAISCSRLVVAPLTGAGQERATRPPL